MGEVELSIENLRKLAELVEKHCLAELTVEENGLCVTIKGRLGSAGQDGSCAPVTGSGTADTGLNTAAGSSGPVAAPLEPSAHGHGDRLERITSPMVGVFYRSPSPDSPACVEVGDTIEVGQVVGLIEAMKVFSEIPSEIAGEVVAIPAQNGSLVQRGDPLIVVRPTEEQAGTSAGAA